MSAVGRVIPCPNADTALPLSQEDLASLIVGTSRATVTRAFSNWRKRRLIHTGQRRVTITDLPGLWQAAGSANVTSAACILAWTKAWQASCTGRRIPPWHPSADRHRNRR
jgi:hypothetical protein